MGFMHNPNILVCMSVCLSACVADSAVAKTDREAPGGVRGTAGRQLVGQSDGRLHAGSDGDGYLPSADGASHTAAG